MPAMIDMHTHITDASFDADRHTILQQAWQAGLKAVVAVGQNVSENEAVLTLAQQEPAILPFLGWHPDLYADKKALPTPTEEALVEAQIRAHATRICGVGEVGLDRWVCQSAPRRERQAFMFERLIRLAVEVNLPLNVHSRSAGARSLALLTKLGAKRVLMHAYDGKASKAMVGVEAGYIFSIPPSIVRSSQKQKLVHSLPLSALALETDSPVLGPIQGVRNEPANAIKVSLQAIANIKGLPIQEVAHIVNQNTARLLGDVKSKAIAQP